MPSLISWNEITIDTRPWKTRVVLQLAYGSRDDPEDQGVGQLLPNAKRIAVTVRELECFCGGLKITTYLSQLQGRP